jgi:hypothetical protein
MRHALALALVATFALALGCGNVSLARLRGASAGASASKKDCAACEKMCAVAGDAEKKPKAVEACQDDCKKSCR